MNGNNYRLTRSGLSCVISAHEHHPNFCDRCWLHGCRTVLARDGPSPGARVVAASSFNKRAATGHHSARQPNIESLAMIRIAVSSQRIHEAQECSRSYLPHLDFRLLLVASISSLIAVPLADAASDSSF